MPILTDGNSSYNNFVDGNKPYIFNDGFSCEKNILFISLSTIGKISDCFNTIRDKDPSYRILKGILDIHEFFIFNKNTIMCSYLNNWTFTNHFIYRLKEFIWINLLYTITIIDYIYKNIPKSIKNNIIFNQLNNISRKFIRDIYIKTIFS